MSSKLRSEPPARPAVGAAALLCPHCGQAALVPLDGGWHVCTSCDVVVPFEALAEGSGVVAVEVEDSGAARWRLFQHMVRVCKAAPSQRDEH